MTSPFDNTDSARPRLDEALITEAIRGLTDRDRQICHLLETHRVLTTLHIQQALFDSPERARHRIALLYRRRLVDRFQPYVENGSAPFHYTLDQLGALVCAAEADRELAPMKPSPLEKWRRSSQLAHLLAVNGLFTSLMGEARRCGAELTTWWSQAQCAKAMGRLVYPDGYGVWSDARGDVEFYAEVDLGTETVVRVMSKINDYEALLDATRANRWVLFLFATERRELEFRRRIPPTRIRVATAAGRGAGQVWSPIREDGRCRLDELAR